jgi:hypothetical protein
MKTEILINPNAENEMEAFGIDQSRLPALKEKLSETLRTWFVESMLNPNVEEINYLPSYHRLSVGVPANEVAYLLTSFSHHACALKEDMKTQMLVMNHRSRKEKGVSTYDSWDITFKGRDLSEMSGRRNEAVKYNYETGEYSQVQETEEVQ